MEQADFTYATARDSAGLAASVSVFADRAFAREQIGDDLRDAGFRALRSGVLADLLDGEVSALGDAVLIECPLVDAERMAALSRLDMRVARSGAQLIVMTSLDALDAVFGAFEQCAPQILVDASRAERMVAVGRILGDVGGARVRDLSAEDRLALLRLTEQVDQIARRLDAGPGKAFAGIAGDHAAPRTPGAASLGDTVQPGTAWPDPALVREMIRIRQLRAKFFDGQLFADPAWDMLLDLTASWGEGRRVSVTSLCIASGVPATTALRWVRQMTEAGLFERVEDAADKRRAFISLSEAARQGMMNFFTEAGSSEALAYAA